MELHQRRDLERNRRLRRFDPGAVQRAGQVEEEVQPLQAAPANAPAILATIFASMRFREGNSLPEADILRARLLERNYDLQIIEPMLGEDINANVFPAIARCDAFLVFGTSDYGQDTGNPASTWHEYVTAKNLQRKIIPLRMIGEEEEFEHELARQIFNPNATLPGRPNIMAATWIEGDPIPDTLVDEIVRSMEGEQGLVAAVREGMGPRNIILFFLLILLIFPWKEKYEIEDHIFYIVGLGILISLVMQDPAQVNGLRLQLQNFIKAAAADFVRAQLVDLQNRLENWLQNFRPRENDRDGEVNGRGERNLRGRQRQDEE